MQWHISLFRRSPAAPEPTTTAEQAVLLLTGQLEEQRRALTAQIAALAKRNAELEARAVLALNGPHAAEAEPILAQMRMQANRIEQLEAQLADQQARVRMAESESLNGGPG